MAPCCLFLICYLFGSKEDTFVMCVFMRLSTYFLLRFLFCLFFGYFLCFILWLFLDLTPGTNVVLRDNMVWGLMLELAAVALGFASESNAHAILLSLKEHCESVAWWRKNCFVSSVVTKIVLVSSNCSTTVLKKNGIRDSNLKVTLRAFIWFGALF